MAGRDTGAISDSYPNLFAPAGYAFSIWGVIYTLLALYVIYQFTRRDDALTARVNRLFIINALFNAVWIFAWHYRLLALSLGLMLVILVCLIMIMHTIRRERPDLVLLDLMLPGMDGLEFLERVQGIRGDLPVIVQTAQGSIELAVNLMKMGAFDFLVKPFDLDQIEALVERKLSTRTA